MGIRTLFHKRRVTTWDELPQSFVSTINHIFKRDKFPNESSYRMSLDYTCHLFLQLDKLLHVTCLPDDICLYMSFVITCYLFPQVTYLCTAYFLRFGLCALFQTLCAYSAYKITPNFTKRRILCARWPILCAHFGRIKDLKKSLSVHTDLYWSWWRERALNAMIKLGIY